MKSILFVCLGNICRSPLAEGIAKDFAKRYNLNLTIQSAGTNGLHDGERPCKHSITIAKKHDIDISQQRSRQVDLSDVGRYDAVLVMEQDNKSVLERMGFEKQFN